MPPRLLKRIWTAREANELRMYDQRFPIDDESNHHVMLALLATMYRNAHIDPKKDDPSQLKDFLPFLPRPKEGEAVNLDDKMKAMLARFKKAEDSE
jgi:hypothetical protein